MARAVTDQPNWTVEADALDTLLPQKPDFIRPSDAMWQDAETARRTVTALSQRIGSR